MYYMSHISKIYSTSMESLFTHDYSCNRADFHTTHHLQNLHKLIT